MHIMKRVVASSGRIASSPAAMLSGWTLLVFIFALTASWQAVSIAQSCGSATNTCVTPGGGGNPCAAYTGCEPTGTGYLCKNSQNISVVEATWQLIASSPWPSCSQVTSTAPSCGYTWNSCGTTLHYWYGTACKNPCTGNWYWAACMAFGTPCSTGSSGGGGG
jgi:hypothetical protein